MSATKRNELEQLLALHKQTGLLLEKQKAQHGFLLPPAVEHGLREACDQIVRVEKELAGVVPDNAIHVDLWTREGANPHTPGAKQLDWSSYFAPEPPSAALWNQELIPQLRALLKLCGKESSCNLALHPKAHMSAAIAFGHMFPTTSLYDLWIEQRPNEWWRSRLDVKASSPLHIDQAEVGAVRRGADTVEQASPQQVNAAALRRILTTYFNENELRNLCFDIDIDYEALPGQGKGDKARELADYARRRNRTNELVILCRRLRPHAEWQNAHPATRSERLSEVSVELSIVWDIRDDVQDTITALGLPIGRRMQLHLAPPHKTVADAGHAKAIAEQVREVIKQARGHSRRRPIHLFAAVPVGLAVLIGAHLNACGPIQCYEHRKDQGDYVPACLLRG